MKKFNMLSGQFSHDVSSTVNQKPKHFTWEFFSKNNNISFYIDMDVIRGIQDKNDGKLKFLWTMESKYFNNGCFDFIKNNLSEVLSTFELIFTYNDELLWLDEKFVRVPAMGSWIKNPEIHEKTKLVSMITSNKTFTPQQKERVLFAENNKKNIDVYGRGFNDIENKEMGLKDYMFSVCIENSTHDTYFTEKILDCFATGTIPIYKGTKNIKKYFDVNGILFLDEINIKDLTPELYYSKIEHVKNNFDFVKNFIIPEDIIYKIIEEKYESS
jgi:hypothetical protein